MRVPMTLHTWTGDHSAVVVCGADKRVKRVLLTRDGMERDITDGLEDDTLAAIESQLLALETGGLDLDGVDAEAHDTGAPDEAPVEQEVSE